jgi:AraC-like DNA-binding protein
MSKMSREILVNPRLLGMQLGERDLSGCGLLPIRDGCQQINQSLICLPSLYCKTRDGAPQDRCYRRFVPSLIFPARNPFPRGLIEIVLEVGYTSPSHFAQVFRRTAGMAPTEFRMLLE